MGACVAPPSHPPPRRGPPPSGAGGGGGPFCAREGGLGLQGEGGADHGQGEGEELDGVPVDQAGAVDVAAAAAAMLEQEREGGEGQKKAGGDPERLGGRKVHRLEMGLRAGSGKGRYPSWRGAGLRTV